MPLVLNVTVLDVADSVLFPPSPSSPLPLSWLGHLVILDGHRFRLITQSLLFTVDNQDIHSRMHVGLPPCSKPCSISSWKAQTGTGGPPGPSPACFFGLVSRLFCSPCLCDLVMLNAVEVPASSCLRAFSYSCPLGLECLPPLL